jgi:lipoprotein signal peptidase
MNPYAKKYIIFGTLFVLWLVADLWSKDWADNYLAESEMRNPHPTSVQAPEGDASGTVRDLLVAYYGMEPNEVDERLKGQVLALNEPASFALDGKVFGASGNHGKYHAYYAYWRGEDAPPVLLYKYERNLLEDWTKIGSPKSSPLQIKEAVRTHLDSVTFSNWLPSRIRGLGDGDIADVKLYPLHPGHRSAVSLDTKVEAGKRYLVKQRYIDVHGDWFKFRYRENPGAAFGFMRDIEPDTRSLIFLILTLVALCVIGVIVFKLPPEARLVNVAMAGILAGAIGNFINRIQFEYVIDFIDMDLGFYHWPTYNIADIGISCGVILLLLDMTFNKDSVLAGPKEESKKKDVEMMSKGASIEAQASPSSEEAS